MVLLEFLMKWLVGLFNYHKYPHILSKKLKEIVEMKQITLIIYEIV